MELVSEHMVMALPLRKLVRLETFLAEPLYVFSSSPFEITHVQTKHQKWSIRFLKFNEIIINRNGEGVSESYVMPVTDFENIIDEAAQFALSIDGYEYFCKSIKSFATKK